jgi:hypothetical protein
VAVWRLIVDAIGPFANTTPPGRPGSGVLSFSCQEGARREYVDANAVLVGQKVVVVGDKGRLRRNTQRCEFPILGIRDEDEALRIDGTKKLHLGPEKINYPLPVEGRNLAEDHLGLSAGRLVPNHLKATLPDGCEDARGCAFQVEARRDEHVGVDYNPSHEHPLETIERRT